ncbi:MAG TPA: hypothetical protein PKW42_07795, partial [bacterium]|nr:hypothetical protein [bacterium]
MLTPEPMELVTLVVFKEKAEAVATRLLELGLFQPADWQNLAGPLQNLSPVQLEREISQWQALETRFRDLVRQLGCEALPSEEKRALTAGEVEEQLSTMEKSFQPIQNRERELTEEIRTREAMLAQVIRSLPVPLPPEKRYSFLEVHLGTMPEKNLPVLERSLSGIPHVFFPVSQERQRGIYLLVGLKRDRALLEAIRKDVGWEKVEFPPEQEGLSRAVEEKLRQELSRLSQQLAALKEQKEQLRERLKEKLSRIAFSIALKKGLLTAHRYMLTT